MTKFSVFSSLFVFLLLFTFLCSCGQAQTAQTAQPETLLSASELFDKMEKRTETIDSLVATVMLTMDDDSTQVRMAIKSPDKFSMDFADKTAAVYFNGEKFWIYLQLTNEVFYHFPDDKSFFSYFSWMNPRKIFTSLTRGTLFTIFEVEAVKSADPATHCLKFTPVMKRLFADVFGIDHYLMSFSSSDYLPSEVVEYDTKGKIIGRLAVLECKLNEKLADESFNFVVPAGAGMTPINLLIREKIEKAGAAAYEKAAEAAGAIKTKLLNWSSK